MTLRADRSVATKRSLGVAPVLMLGVAASAAASAAAGSTDPGGRRRVTLGRSIEGRSITAIETGDPDRPAKELVVGCIHSDECAGTAVAERLACAAPPPELDLWIVPDLKPRRVGSRQVRQRAQR